MEESKQPDSGLTSGAAAAEVGQEDDYTPKQFASDLVDLIESMLTAVFVVILVFTYICTIASVEGDSMVPTLEDGNRLFVWRIGQSYKTGDILILDSEKSYTFDKNNNLIEGRGLGKRIVKRLIAQGGQEVRIDFTEGIVYVDGEALSEPYTSSLTTYNQLAFDYPIVIPEGYVFVLGDNRHISRDSRHPLVGLIPESDIIGKAVLRISPLSSFGRLS